MAQVVEGLAQTLLPELIASSTKFDMFHLDASMKSAWAALGRYKTWAACGVGVGVGVVCEPFG